ncbi:hypothetical protein CMU39_09210 [Elizabethkingia anophelis]|nr:hypothetical protein [Elizabethkingia anophelis]
MKLSELKPGQKVKINGKLYEYLGIQKRQIRSFAKVDKRTFKGEGKDDYVLFSLNEGSKTLKSENIEIIL